MGSGVGQIVAGTRQPGSGNGLTDRPPRMPGADAASEAAGLFENFEPKENYMLSISRRDCRLGTKYTGDLKETDGEPDAHVLTIEIEDVMLDSDELNAMLGEPNADRALYDMTADPVEPRLNMFKALEFKEGSEGAHCEITYGPHLHTAVFRACKLSRIRLACQTGGRTAFSCKVTATPELDESLGELIEQLGNAAEVEIRAETLGAQKDLPLNTFGTDETPIIQGAKPRDLATAHGVSEPRIYQIIKASKPSRPQPDGIRIGVADGAA